MWNDQGRRDQRGQATIEFALVVPLVLVCASVLVAITLSCLRLIQLHELARLATRAAVTATEPEAMVRSVLADHDVDVLVIHDEDDGTITVEVSARSRVPLLTTVGRGLGLTARSTMMREAPPILAR